MARFLLTTIACLLFAAHFAVAAVPACGGLMQDVVAQDAAVQAAVCVDEVTQQDGAAPFADAEHAKPCHDHLGYFRRVAEPLLHVRSPARLVIAGRDMHPVSQEIFLPPPQ